MPDLSVNGLPLPTLLLQLLAEGRWRHPGEAALRQAIPWIEDPLNFLSPPYTLAYASIWEAVFDRDDDYADFLHVARRSQSLAAIDLSWLDVEQAVFIIENRYPGDDQGVALDYRTSHIDPRVVASDWAVRSGCLWREVAPTFSAFVAMLGL